MITLDKIKIVAPLNSIAVVDDNKFECKVRKGAVTSRSYTQVVPFQLYVEQDYEDKESILEFTGKILSDKYPDLINSENFDLCIDRINGMGFCLIDKNMIREYGRACVVDVTKDVRIRMSPACLNGCGRTFPITGSSLPVISEAIS